MAKKTLLGISAFLIIFSVIGYFYLNYQRFLAQRHHLLCEILKPGMSKEEVLSILKQAGDITVGDTDSPGKFVELRINFTDPKGRDVYGAFNLAFIDNKYERAYRRIGSDNFESICVFYQPTQSATTIPKQ